MKIESAIHFTHKMSDFNNFDYTCCNTVDKIKIIKMPMRLHKHIVPVSFEYSSLLNTIMLGLHNT